MRPLFNFGLKPEQFARVIMELHAKRHCQVNLDYEHDLTRKRGCIDFPAGASLELFSTFADRTRYGGRVPSGSFFGNIYMQHHDVRPTLLSPPLPPLHSGVTLSPTAPGPCALGSRPRLNEGRP